MGDAAALIKKPKQRSKAGQGCPRPSPIRIYFPATMAISFHAFNEEAVQGRMEKSEIVEQGCIIAGGGGE